VTRGTQARGHAPAHRAEPDESDLHGGILVETLGGTLDYAPLI